MVDYKELPSIPVGIHTRINDTVRISSAWRTFENIHFSARAWETFLWDGDKIIGEYDTERSAENVIDLHMRIVESYTT